MTRLICILLTLLFSLSGPAIGRYSGFKRSSNAANNAGRANTLVHNGMEVRAVRDLNHIDDSTLGAIVEKGFEPRTINGDKIVLHHHQQYPAGFIVGMPAKNHNIWNTNQHPFGNAPGVGLSAEKRLLLKGGESITGRPERKPKSNAEQQDNDRRHFSHT